ncbi:hypothetical protein [Streptomyces benahoarensis]|uniref:Uncharacterized protein n=1 Tax=Streptomyces benahoarensis TaxID=2595054 RepID=A0A553ZLA9_9ACTN|nr:hypothetical protein [Streptomyces benahoarensis]TSB22439.1 hypothetical protein FNJ62_16330 [Streptomyces benahoarensis]TSB42210.1 hypothetical protein FNZ23_11080 [Streptomyces benahoarensis]
MTIFVGFGVTAFGLASVAASLGYVGAPGTLTVKECREVGGRTHGQKCFGPVRATDGTLLEKEASVDAELPVGARVAVRRVVGLTSVEGCRHIGVPGLVAGAGLLLAGYSVPYFTTGTFPWRGTPPPGAELCKPGPRARLTRTVLCIVGVCIGGVCVIASLV